MTVGSNITVGIGVALRGNTVLLTKRYAPEIPEYHSKWELPGGKIEQGEAVEEAIEREILEETGVPVRCQELLPFSYSRSIVTLQERTHVNVICARCTVRQSEPFPSGENPQQASLWMPIDEVPFEYVVPGSKEFLVWTLVSCGHELKNAPKAAIYDMTLQLVDARQNKMRRYQVIVTFRPKMQERFEVACKYGRMGSGFRQTTKTFGRMQEALEFAKKVVATRKDHGYELVAIDENHPLRSWLANKGVQMGENRQLSLFDDLGGS